MNIGEIVKDSLRYPLSDWKKILVLGIILLLYTSHFFVDLLLMIFATVLNMIGIGESVSTNVMIGIFMGLFNLIGLFILIFIFGYYFRIIRSSLKGGSELPQFNHWMDMFKDGIKVYIIFIIYLIPLVLFTLLSGSLKIIAYPVPISEFISFSWIFINSVFAKDWIIVLLTFYLFIIISVSYVAIANMANDNGKLSSAFKFREIFNKITTIGSKKLITFYMVTVIPISLISYIAIVFGTEVTYLPISLIIAPYLAMFTYRILALFYKSDKESMHSYKKVKKNNKSLNNLHES